MDDFVLRDDAGGIVTLTLNRPQERNPISHPQMIEALIDQVMRADADMATRVIIITGTGTAFSSGGDVKMMKLGGGLRDPAPPQTRRNYRAGIQRLPLMFDALETPVIAAVNGAAIGAGCDLACMCDLRVASTHAKFAESFVKLGIIPGDGGAWLLPRIVGFSKACEMALTGDMIDASEALAIGLVSKVVAPDALMTEARALAERIARNPPHAVRMTRRLLREGQTASLASLLELSAAMQSLAHTTADHEEAVDAFLEKRSPRFTGR